MQISQMSDSTGASYGFRGGEVSHGKAGVEGFLASNAKFQ